MNKILGAVIFAALVLPTSAYAVDKAGKVKTWVAATKVVTLEDNTACTLAATAAVPATLAVGKDVTLTYTTAGAVNTCSAIVVKELSVLLRLSAGRALLGAPGAFAGRA